MHLVCPVYQLSIDTTFVGYISFICLDKDKCQTLFFLWPFKTGICDAFARKQGTSDLLPKVINFTESN